MTTLLNRIGIDGYQVLRTEATKPLKIHVKPEARTCSCPCCGGGRLHSKGRYQKQVRHLDRFGEPTCLVVHTRRLRCRDCHHCFVPPLPGILAGRHSSEPFREDAYRQYDNGICVSTLARILHIGSATIERIYHQFTERKAKERLSLRCPMVLGIDEHTLHKGQPPHAQLSSEWFLCFFLRFLLFLNHLYDSNPLWFGFPLYGKLLSVNSIRIL